MNIEDFRAYCLSKTGAEEGFPFDEQTLVFKVAGKMFALCALEHQPISVNLKSEPEYSIELRERYPDVILPGYHMSKLHWNTILLEANLEMKMYTDLIDRSYRLVRQGLKKSLKQELEDMESDD